MKKIKCILLPGLDGTGNLFTEFVSEISRYADAVIISYPQDSLLDYRELATFVISQLPNDEDYCIIAESFSGPIGILIANEKPEHMKCLVLVATFDRSPYPLIGKFLLKLLPIIQLLPIPKIAIRFFLLNGLKRDLVSEIHNAVLSINPMILANRVREVLLCNLSDKLAKLKIPVLAIGANNDRLLPKTCLTKISDSLPRSEIRRIASPHFVLQSKAEEVWGALIHPFLIASFDAKSS